MRITDVRWDDITNSMAVMIEGCEGVEFCIDIDTIEDEEDFKNKIRARVLEHKKEQPVPEEDKIKVEKIARYEKLKNIEI